MVESFEGTKIGNGEESRRREARDHVMDATPPLKAAVPRFGNHTQKVDANFFEFKIIFFKIRNLQLQLHRT
jgi:hypothetical protein